ncbi:hypothetical protein B0H16DRAFT_1453383 [Mycena metata]|uniref:Uncharacterized protein n=1 Tax=Mycena metata TaxID=1033252 RepID=A0AAD7JMK4_9AGAR|nr:hypothetical protein B0H16DRAFT_1453383 [Mycena metata]
MLNHAYVKYITEKIHRGRRGDGFLLVPFRVFALLSPKFSNSASTCAYVTHELPSGLPGLDNLTPKILCPKSCEAIETDTVVFHEDSIGALGWKIDREMTYKYSLAGPQREKRFMVSTDLDGLQRSRKATPKFVRMTINRPSGSNIHVCRKFCGRWFHGNTKASAHSAKVRASCCGLLELMHTDTDTPTSRDGCVPAVWTPRLRDRHAVCCFFKSSYCRAHYRPQVAGPRRLDLVEARGPILRRRGDVAHRAGVVATRKIFTCDVCSPPWMRVRAPNCSIHTPLSPRPAGCELKYPPRADGANSWLPPTKANLAPRPSLAREATSSPDWDDEEGDGERGALDVLHPTPTDPPAVRPRSHRDDGDGDGWRAGQIGRANARREVKEKYEKGGRWSSLTCPPPTRAARTIAFFRRAPTETMRREVEMETKMGGGEFKEKYEKGELLTCYTYHRPTHAPYDLVLAEPTETMRREMEMGGEWVRERMGRRDTVRMRGRGEAGGGDSEGGRWSSLNPPPRDLVRAAPTETMRREVEMGEWVGQAGAGTDAVRMCGRGSIEAGEAGGGDSEGGDGARCTHRLPTRAPYDLVSAVPTETRRIEMEMASGLGRQPQNREKREEREEGIARGAIKLVAPTADRPTRGARETSFFLCAHEPHPSLRTSYFGALYDAWRNPDGRYTLRNAPRIQRVDAQSSSSLTRTSSSVFSMFMRPRSQGPSHILAASIDDTSRKDGYTSVEMEVNADGGRSFTCRRGFHRWDGDAVETNRRARLAMGINMSVEKGYGTRKGKRWSLDAQQLPAGNRFLGTLARIRSCSSPPTYSLQAHLWSRLMLTRLLRAAFGPGVGDSLYLYRSGLFRLVNLLACDGHNPHRLGVADPYPRSTAWKMSEALECEAVGQQAEKAFEAARKNGHRFVLQKIVVGATKAEAADPGAFREAKQGLVYDLNATSTVKRGQSHRQTDVHPPALRATADNPHPLLLSTLVLEKITYTNRGIVLHFGGLFFMVDSRNQWEQSIRNVNKELRRYGTVNGTAVAAVATVISQQLGHARNLRFLLIQCH